MSHQTPLVAVDLVIPHWVGAAELQTLDQGAIHPWRLPVKMLDFLEPRTAFQAANPSGVRLRFVTCSTILQLHVKPDGKEQRWFDLRCDNQLVGRVTLEKDETCVTFSKLPAGEKTLELWLNHMYRPVIVESLHIEKNATFTCPPEETRKRILFYGSSISHGRKADGPSESWTVGAAHQLGLEPLNLGLGGACTLESAVARYIRDSRADYLSFCLGINVMAGMTHAPRVFRSAVVGLIQLVREKHPFTPMAVQSGIFVDGPSETTPNAVGMSMISCREQVREVVECFIRHGDEKIIFTDGLELMGPGDASLLFDGIHPNGEGHRLMSQRYADIVWPRLEKLA